MDVQDVRSRIRDYLTVLGNQRSHNTTNIVLSQCIPRVYFADTVRGTLPAGLRDTTIALRFAPMAEGEEMLVRVGMSFISSSQACSNAETEIPTYDFRSVVHSSQSQFSSLLNRIRVSTTSVPSDTLALFYSSVTSGFHPN
jgi:putative alpha-1,2-mannosidase